ncbi:MAG: sporulation protein YabP [Clostridium sp.]|nr:sporulation protein YabP [Clostridium sp.]
MEKKSENRLDEPRSNITLENRKKLTLTGVEEVISFDDEKILLNTKLGFLTIKGSDLKMNKLDVQNGDVIIVGNVASVVYSSKEVKKEKESIISRLFK